MTTAVEEQREQWQVQYEQQKLERNEAAAGLTDHQRRAIRLAWAALSSAECNIREMFDIDMDDARNISRAEGYMRSAFPGLVAEEEN